MQLGILGDNTGQSLQSSEWMLSNLEFAITQIVFKSESTAETFIQTGRAF